MADAGEAEARLRQSLGYLRREVTDFLAAPDPEETLSEERKDTFEDRVRSAMDGLKAVWVWLKSSGKKDD
jgi:hypothetical protein